jgi:hypothetical protein
MAFARRCLARQKGALIKKSLRVISKKIARGQSGASLQPKAGQHFSAPRPFGGFNKTQERKFR